MTPAQAGVSIVSVMHTSTVPIPVMVTSPVGATVAFPEVMAHVLDTAKSYIGLFIRGA